MLSADELLLDLLLLETRQPAFVRDVDRGGVALFGFRLGRLAEPPFLDPALVRGVLLQRGNLAIVFLIGIHSMILLERALRIVNDNFLNRISLLFRQRNKFRFIILVDERLQYFKE